MRSEFVAESGCPITVSNIRTELDMDPFDVPVDARIYVDYQNVSARPIVAAKFRFRFVDDAGTNLGSFQGPDGAMVAPGQTASQKWRDDKVDPNSSHLLVRVLIVKYADGEIWQSVKLPVSTDPDSVRRLKLSDKSANDVHQN